MKMSKLGYFFEFLLFPPLVLIATLFAFRSSMPPQPLTWAIVYGAGLMAWTLFEYVLHRVLFHHAPVLSEIHDRHHQSPQELIGTPAWASAIVGLLAVASPLAWRSDLILGLRRRRASSPATFGTSSSTTRPTIGNSGEIPIFTGRACATLATTIFRTAEISA